MALATAWLSMAMMRQRGHARHCGSMVMDGEVGVRGLAKLGMRSSSSMDDGIKALAMET